MRPSKPVKARNVTRRLKLKAGAQAVPVPEGAMRAAVGVWKKAVRAGMVGTFEQSGRTFSAGRNAQSDFMARVGLDSIGEVRIQKRKQVTAAVRRFYSQLGRLRAARGNLEFRLSLLGEPRSQNSRIAALAGKIVRKQSSKNQPRIAHLWQRGLAMRMLLFGTKRLDAEKLIEEHSRTSAQIGKLVAAPPASIQKLLGKRRSEEFWKPIREQESRR